MATSYEQLTYNCPDGATMGSSSTEKISFYGSTPITRPSVSTAISTTASISNSPYGFATSSEAMQIVNAVSTLTYAMTQLGLINAI